jgi:hypothetical protein
MTTTERSNTSPDDLAQEMLDDTPPDERVVPHCALQLTASRREQFVTVLPPNTDQVSGGGRSAYHTGRPHGIEVRVHGIGDHATFSALGRPKYKELVDSRVWIGEVPPLPTHQLRLVNWSRANRQITRHLSWYLAFPFTLLNVAGYMEPKERWPRYLMRAGVALASICLSVSMAAWITVILETAWRAVVFEDDRLTGVVLQAIGPSLLIVFVMYRIFVGRALVDKGGALISVTTIAALISMVFYLHSKPASETGGWLHRRLVNPGDGENAADAMTTIVTTTTTIVWLIALALCVFALWKKRDGAAYAGAAILLVLAVTLLHAAGSMLRLFTASLVGFVPSNNDRLVHISPGTSMRNVLLPKPDDLHSEVVTSVGNALRIDLIPVFFIAMLALSAAIFWVELQWQHRRTSKAVSPKTADDTSRRYTKGASRTHDLVLSLPTELATPATLAILATGIVWMVMCAGFTDANPRLIGEMLLTLQIVGAVAILLIIVRRPEKMADRLRRTFGSVADIAGFWAPDLHPLAGASYRRSLISGIRQAINDLVLQHPSAPIALVGHSQGSVVCAWFIRGGHWTEQPTEGCSDRRALRDELLEASDSDRSDRIALFTCGSPLSTLYETFFPRYFDQSFFRKTSSMTYRGTWWRNYWRKTDPIGSPLSVRRPVDNVDVTERMDEETMGHGEYWREARLRGGIARFFGSAEVKPRATSASTMRMTLG